MVTGLAENETGMTVQNDLSAEAVAIKVELRRFSAKFSLASHAAMAPQSKSLS